MRRRALALDPAYGAFDVMVAEMAAQHRRYAQAVEIARRGVALDSTSWSGHALIGLTELRLGNVDAARNRFKDRLLEQAFSEAVNGVPAEAATAEPFEAPEAVMETVRATMKAALLRQAFQQVVEELSEAEVSITDYAIPADLSDQLKAQFKQQILAQTFEETHRAIRPSDAALPEEATNADAMQPVREAFKTQLLAQVMQEAMEEIRDEVEAAPEHMMARSAPAVWNASWMSFLEKHNKFSCNCRI